MEHNLHTRKLQISWRSHEGRLPVHESINHAALALTPPLHLQYRQSADVTSADSGWREKMTCYFVLLCAHRRAGMPEKKNRNEGDAQP
jgi:hypothetical protein